MTVFLISVISVCFPSKRNDILHFFAQECCEVLYRVRHGHFAYLRRGCVSVVGGLMFVF